MVNSRQKGVRIEKEATYLFRKHGFTARRGQQFKGGHDSPDIVVEELPDWHFEVKGDNSNVTPVAWMEQAVKETRKDWNTYTRPDGINVPRPPQVGLDVRYAKVPCILWKPTRKPWRAILRCLLMIPADGDAPILHLVDSPRNAAHVALLSSDHVELYEDLVELDGEDLVQCLAQSVGVGSMP